MNFREYYQEEKKKPSPAKQFIHRIASLTKCDEKTVKFWISGTQKPSMPLRKIIAQHFGVDTNVLFPPEGVRRREN